MKTARRIPAPGEIIKFYDDGKVGRSRRYWAKVEKTVTLDEAKNITVNHYDGDISLYDAWILNISDCDWLYAQDTDLMICCYIPAYDDNRIWFVRDKNGGWFSIDIQQSWQAGRLDVDNDYYPNEEWDFTWEDDMARPYGGHIETDK